MSEIKLKPAEQERIRLNLEKLGSSNPALWLQALQDIYSRVNYIAFEENNPALLTTAQVYREALGTQITALIEQPDQQIHRLACALSGLLKLEEAVPRLNQLLDSQTLQPDSQKEIGFALSQLHHESSFAALMRWQDWVQPSLKGFAFSCLVRLADPRAALYYLELLKPASSTTVEQALHGLAYIKQTGKLDKEIEQLFLEKLNRPECLLHRAKLEIGYSKVIYGWVEIDSENETAERTLFPQAHTVNYGGCTISSDDPPYIGVLCCPECRQAEAEWVAEQKKRGLF